MPENDLQHNEKPGLSPAEKGQDSDHKNAGRATAFRIVGVYLLAFVLLLLLDAGRAAPMLERDGAELDMPLLRTAGQTLRRASEATGLAALTRLEGQVLASLSPKLTLGAVTSSSPGSSGPEFASSESAGPEAASSESAGPEAASPKTAALAGPAAAASGQGAVPATVAQKREAAAVDAALNDLRRSVEGSPENAQGSEAPASMNPAGKMGPASNPALNPAPGPAQNPAPGPVPELAERKPRVLLIGDSMMMEGFGPVLQRLLRARPDLEVIREGKYSTGLSRVDYFDWGAYLRELIVRDAPDMVVICLGANDPQDIIDANGKRHIADSPSWRELYLGRAKALLRAATEGGAQVIWVGLPIMSKEPYSTRIRHLSDLQEEACASYMLPGEPGRARFVNTVAVLADAQGAYAAFAEDAKGQPVRLRYKDKVHVTEEGGRRLSQRVIPFILEGLGLPEKAPQRSGRAGTAPPSSSKAAGTTQKTSSER